MKRFIIVVLALTAILSMACTKDTEINTASDTSNNDSLSTIEAVADGGLTTKGDYTISVDVAAFEWTSGDAFYRIIRADNYGNYTHRVYTASSIDGASASFTGDPVGSGYEDTGFAFYPTGGVNAGSEFGYSNNYRFSVYLTETAVTYDVSNPLKNIVPMIGTLDEVSGKYNFKPATGVIAVPIKGIPSDATSVSISTSTNGFTGKKLITSKDNAAYKTDLNTFLGPDSDGLIKNWFNKPKTFSISNLNPNNTYPFYFPAPIGTYEDLTITIKSGSETLAAITASGISLAIGRAELVPLNTLNLNYQGTKVSANITGPSNAIAAYYTVSKGTVTCVRATALNSKTQAALDEAIPNSTSGTDITSGTDSGSAVVVNSGFNKSGAYYIGIKAFNGTKEVASYIFPSIYYYLSPSDAAKFCKQHTDGQDKLYNDTLVEDMTITFAPSDTPTNSNIMLTEFDGMSYNAVPPTGARFYARAGVEEGLSFTAGNPMKGIYNPSLGFDAMNCEFTVPSSTPFFTYDGQQYTLQMKNNTSGFMRFRLNRHSTEQYENFYIRVENNEIKLRYITPVTQSVTYSKAGFRAYEWDTWTED